MDRTFYIIQTYKGCYLHYGPNGERCDCWGSPLSAERFDTLEEARRFLRREKRPGGDLDGVNGASVCRVSQTVSLTTVA